MLEFDHITHTYAKNGVNLPSVTQLIDTACPDAFYHVPPEVMEKARQRGTAVHKITELHDKGILSEDSIDPDLSPYFDAYKAFLHRMCPVFDRIECIVDSELYKYAGTLDRTGRMQGYAFIIDIKTCSCESKWTGVQTSAYNKALNDEIYRKRFGLYLKSTGKYKLVEYANPQDFNIFLSILNIRNFKNKK